MSALRYSSITLAILMLTGCGLFSPIKNDQTRYQLSSIPNVRVKHTHQSTLLVFKPETIELYNTTKMIYKKCPYQVAYFAKNKWADNPTNMLQQLIVQTVQNTHYYRAVVTPPFTGRYEYSLNTQLIELQQDFTEHPSVVRVKLRAQLINGTTGRVIRAKQFSAIACAPQESPQGGVIAANRAMDQILRELSEFSTR
jgi:cholesterol transport system auxiliary component